MPTYSRFRLAALAILCAAAPLDVSAQRQSACDDTTATAAKRVDACRADAKKHPKSALARRRAADALAAASKLEDAIKDYRQALGLDSMDVATHHGLGHALSRLDRDDEAIRAFRVGLAIEPRNMELRADVISLLAYLERTDTVEIEIAELKRITPDSATALKAAGDALYAADLFEDALPFFERAVKLDPRTFVHHSDLGYTLANVGRIDDAIKAFSRGLAQSPRDTAARAEVARFLFRADKPVLAAAQYDTVARLAPKDPTPLRLKGDVLLNMGRVDDAIAAYRQAVARGPDVSGAHYDLGNGYLAAGQPEKALAEFEIAVRLDSTSAVNHNDRGVALEQLGRFDEAAEAYGRAVALDSTEELFEANYVQAVLRTGRTDEGKRLAKEFLARDRNSATRLAKHAEMMLQIRDFDAVISSANAALRIDSTMVDTYLHLGIALMSREQLERADEVLALGVAQDSAAAKLWVIRALMQSGQQHHAQAMVFWDRARELEPALLDQPSVKPYYEASLTATRDSGSGSGGSAPRK